MGLKIFTLFFHFLVIIAKKWISGGKNHVAFRKILIQCPCRILIEQCQVDILAQVAHLRGGYAKQVDNFPWF